MLEDKFGRKISYLRLAVTDKCNLRCTYCMPTKNMKFLPKKEILTLEELFRVTSVLSQEGINKVRITGGEPFARSGIMELIEDISQLPKVDAVNITTNGLIAHAYLDKIKKSNVNSLNLSLDSLDRTNFFNITRFDSLLPTLDFLYESLDLGLHIKLNMVVMNGSNDHEVIDMAKFALKHKVALRYIEEMPFNGKNDKTELVKPLTHLHIKDMLEAEFGNLLPRINAPGSTSVNYTIDGYETSIGIIPAYSRTFCGDCNRMRITATGELKTCLYQKNGTSLKSLLRDNCSDEELISVIKSSIGQKPKDGFAAEANYQKHDVFSSMSTIGG